MLTAWVAMARAELMLIELLPHTVLRTGTCCAYDSLNVRLWNIQRIEGLEDFFLIIGSWRFLTYFSITLH